MPTKWKVISGVTLALVLMAGTLLFVSNRSYQAGKKAQGEPVVVKDEPAAPAATITKEDVEQIVNNKLDALANTFTTRADELAKAKASERESTLTAVDAPVEKALAAARAQNWREYQGDFARRGARLTGLTVSVASPTPEPAPSEPETKNADPAPAEPAQTEPAGDAAPPQPSAEPQP